MYCSTIGEPQQFLFVPSNSSVHSIMSGDNTHNPLPQPLPQDTRRSCRWSQAIRGLSEVVVMFQWVLVTCWVATHSFLLVLSLSTYIRAYTHCGKKALHDFFTTFKEKRYQPNGSSTYVGIVGTFIVGTSFIWWVSHTPIETCLVHSERKYLRKCVFNYDNKKG